MGQAIRKTDPSRNGEHGLWQTPGSALTVEYSFEVLERIRNWTLEGYRSLSRGGIESGGVLFGLHEGRLLRLLDVRQIACEHAHGPAFVLSERDERDLERLLAEAAHDPDLEGLEPLGWYVSHTRSGLSLSDRDLDLHSRFFPQWWQLVLVTRQAEGGAISAGFFVRGRNGTIGSEPAGGVLEIGPYSPAGRRSAGPVPAPAGMERTKAAPEPIVGPAEAAAPRPEPTPSASRESAPGASALAGIEAEPDGERPAEEPPEHIPAAVSRERAPFGAQFRREMPDEPEPKPKRRLWLWVPAALAVFAAGVIAGPMLMERAASPQPATAAPAPQAPFLGLKLYDREGQLEVAWDRAAGPIIAATRGVIEIEERGADGTALKTSSLDLNADAVRRGSAIYAREGARVDFRLTVWPERGQPVSEYASFVGPPPGRATPQTAAAEQELKETTLERDRAAGEVERLRRTNVAQAARIKELEEAIVILRRRAATEESLRRRGR